MKKIPLFEAFNNHFKANIWLYMISLLCLCTGIVIGIYVVKDMGNMDKGLLGDYLNSLMKISKDGTLSGKEVFLQAFKNSMPFLLVIWFLGLTLIGIPFILVLDLLKGFTFGFSIGFILNDMSFKGITFVLLEILPQNIFYIPGIIIASVVAMNFSLRILKELNRGNLPRLWTKISNYSIMFICLSVLVLIGSLIQGYVDPKFLNIVACISRDYI
ncbi:MAG TPA: stage II sporulation protein M [Clostridiaceae bacterium]